MNNTPYHLTYIIGSFLAALIATVGIFVDVPMLYGIVPGLIGGSLAMVATIRFLKDKIDLAGFVATTCGFVFYQAFQANPVMLPEFTATLSIVAPVDKCVGIFLGNFTTGLLLLAYHAVAAAFERPMREFVLRPIEARRENLDARLLTGFWVAFGIVAI